MQSMTMMMALVLTVIAPAQTDDFATARDALFRGQYERAIDLFSKLVDADTEGSDLRARLHLAKAYGYAARTDEAEPILREILAKAPDHAEAGRALSDLLRNAERWAELKATLEPLLKYRRDYETYHSLAEAAYHTDATTAARSYYERAIGLNPDNGLDHYRLGTIYLADGAFARAATSLQRARDRGVDSALLHFKLASAYFNLRSYFGKLERMTVKSGQPGELHGRHFLVERLPGGDDTFLAAPPASAAYQIEQAIAKGLGDRPDVRMLRANTYLNGGRFDRAHELFAELEPAVPDEEQALFHFYFAQAAFGLDDYDRYLELLREAIRLDPDAYGSALVIGLVRVAEQHDRAGRLERYIEFLEQAVDASPQTGSLHRRLADAYAEAERFADAVVQWRLVLDLEPDHPERAALLAAIERYR